MPDPLTHPPPGIRRRALARLLAFSAGLVALVACADRIVAPDSHVADSAVTPVQSLAVSDVVDRVAPSLRAGTQTAQLANQFAELRNHMEAGRLSDAELSLVLVRKALTAAREVDDGAMDADLTVIELALDDAGQLIGAASTESQGRRRR